MNEIHSHIGSIPTNDGDVHRPKMLFLCQTLPFPPDGGVQIRSFNILRLLSQCFDITALCFFRQATRSTPEAVMGGVAGLSPYARVEAFSIPQEHSKSRMLWDHMRSILSRRVYTRFAYESVAFMSRLRTLLREECFDIVHMDSLDLSLYLPALPHIPVVCTHHNVESALLMRRAKTERSTLRKRYLQLQARFMESEEKRYCGMVSLNVVVSPEDARCLAAHVPEAAIQIVPNGVDTKVFLPGAGGHRGVVFVGGASWFPNRDAMEYFAHEILPLLRHDQEDLQVTWVGRSSDAIRDTYNQEHGIELTGYVDSIEPYVAEAACYIVPLRVGGGTRLKILDAWAMGKAVVSTSVGCEGLDARDGENILIRDTPQAFAAGVRQILTDTTLRRRLAAAARDTAERTYDWDVIGSKMIAAYSSLARKGRPVST